MSQTSNPPLVLIEWLDSGQPVPRWQWLSEIKPRAPHRCVSVGFLIQDDDETKTLAPNLGASAGDTDWDQASGITTIPAAAVQRLERLTWPESEASSVTPLVLDKEVA